MIEHVSIGVRNIGATKVFYGSVLGALGYSPVPADPKSGLHFCFSAPSRESVDAFYEALLANGGGDNGKPGIRKDYGPNYFAAYVIDPDGYQ
jgi:catechol 2,3-dioxygenase-like lactoylglutathione lyase family enzyme